MKTLIDGADYVVRMVDFPDATVGGAVMTCEDGTYNIYINTRRSREEQSKSFWHEINHIIQNDFYNKKSIYEIESFFSTEKCS